MTTHDPARSPVEYGIIVSSLNRIRRRLWLTRMIERLAIALASGAVVSVFLIGARLLRERFPAWSFAVALLPILLAAWFWFRLPKARGPVINPLLIRIGCGIAAALSLATVAIFAFPGWQFLPIWAFYTASMVTFGLAAAVSVRLIDTRTAAIFVDQQIGLRERVSTALEFIDSPETTPLEASFRKPLIDSALAACTDVRNSKVGYARLDRRVYALSATTIVAAVGISLLNPLPAIATRGPQQITVVKNATDTLAKVLQELEEKKIPQNGSKEEKKLDPLKTAIQDIRKGNMNEFEAAERLAQARSEMQKTEDAMAAATKVEAALDAVKNLDDFNKAANEMKQAEMKAQGGDSGAAQAKAGAQTNMDGAAKALGDKLNSGKMSDGEKNALANDLKSAAEKAKGDPELKKELENAAKAAQKGDGNELSKAMSNAGNRMSQQSASNQLSGQALKDAMAACDGACSGLGGDEQQANKQGQKGQSEEQSAGDKGGKNGGQQGQGGDEQQANNGGGGKQDQGQDGQGDKGGGQQQAGGKSGGSGKDGQDGSGEGGNSGQASAGGSPKASQGSGSTNMHQRGGPGDQYQGRDIGAQGTFVKLYEENKVASKGEQLKVSGKINPLAPSAGSMDIFAQADKSDKTIVDYSSERAAVRAKALDDLSKDEIPPQYRDMIRSYYEK